MAARIDLAEIQALADGGAYAGTYTLSDESVALVLSWLALLFHSNWIGEGFGLTSSETDTIDDMIAQCLNELMEPVEVNGMELGTVMAFAGETIPDDWLLCDGAMHDKDDYPDLYDAIDDIFHIDSFSFRLPDLAARTVVGEGGIPAYSRNVGDVGGAPVHYLTEAEMPAHTHGIRVAGSLSDPPEDKYRKPYHNTYWDTQESLSAGGDEAHENMPPFLVLCWIIYAGAPL